MNLFDRGNKKSVLLDLKWINEPDEWRFGRKDELVINVPDSADFFRDPSGRNIKFSAPFFYMDTKEDFMLTTRVAVDMKDPYDSGCLMVMIDESNWAKLCFELIGNDPSIVSVVTKGISDDCISQKIGVAKPYLRIARSGNCFAFHFSLDAIKWTMVRYFGMNVPSELKIGIAAQCPTGRGCSAEFEFLEYSNEKVKDIKIVE